LVIVKRLLSGTAAGNPAKPAVAFSGTKTANLGFNRLPRYEGRSIVPGIPAASPITGQGVGEPAREGAKFQSSIRSRKRPSRSDL
jgi:hypothetical protein